MTRYVDLLDAYWIKAAGESADGAYEMEADGLAMDRLNPPHDENPRRGSMPDLKQRIEGREYKVDSDLVTEEIIKRLRLAHWARTVLLSDGARNRRRPASAG